MLKRTTVNIDLTKMEKEILLKYFPNGVCAFDLEMTGLSPIFDKIIEIAAIKLLPDGSVEFFHELINPLIEIPEHTIQFHQLTNEQLRNAPTLKKPLREFINFYGNLPLMAHNAMFDASFLIRGIHEYNYEISLSSIFDSCKFARGLYKGKEIKPENFKLSTCAEFFKIDFNHHQALDDAVVCLKVFANTLIEHDKNHSSDNFKAHSYLFKLNAFQKPEQYILPNKLKEIKTYLVDRKPFYIRYKGGQSKGKYRKVKPISLLPLPQGLVLYAECLKDRMNKYFYIKKIQKICEKDLDDE